MTSMASKIKQKDVEEVLVVIPLYLFEILYFIIIIISTLMFLTGLSLGMNNFHSGAVTLSAGKSGFQTTIPHIFGLVRKVLARR
jgi:hypothetical protein